MDAIMINACTRSGNLAERERWRERGAGVGVAGFIEI